MASVKDTVSHILFHSNVEADPSQVGDVQRRLPGRHHRKHRGGDRRDEVSGHAEADNPTDVGPPQSSAGPDPAMSRTEGTPATGRGSCTVRRAVATTSQC